MSTGGIERKRPHFEAGAEARRILSRFEGRPLDDSDIARDANGRPFLQQQPQVVDFNIAHSGSLAAVSCVKGPNLRTGCDVERIRPRARAKEIADEYFSIQERNYVSPRGKLDETRFFAIWTLKECFLKLRGFSVFDMAVCPSFIGTQDDFVCSTVGTVPVFFYLYELSGDDHYMLSTALEGEEQQPPEITWFSQESLTCKMTAEIKAAVSPAATVRPKM